jgi:hypothetical protein
MRPYHYPAYWYNPYIPMIKYADASWWQNVTPYLQAGGIGAGIGALGGAGVGALMGKGDWKKALKSALIGMVAGAVAGPAVYAGYSALFPGERTVTASPVTLAPTQSAQPAVLASMPPGPGGPPIVEDLRAPKMIPWLEAYRLVRQNEQARQEWELQARPLSAVALQQILQSVGYNVVVAPNR